MPLIIQKEWFTKEQIKSNPDTWFVFGDNEMRQGTGGQAKPCRGEPNTIGIRTKRKPKTDPDAYWTDETVEDNLLMIDQDFACVESLLEEGHTVIFPAAGVGTGLAKLDDNAPKTMRHIERWVEWLRLNYCE